MRSVLVATDKFKGSLDAVSVAGAVATGIRAAAADTDIRTCPVADGGDGTLAAALAAGYTEVPVSACGPTGEAVATRYARIDDVAVVELADVSGLGRLPGGQPAPLAATSRGTGEVIRAAVAAGCRRIVLGIGGSACTDGGAGMVQALGARLLDEHGEDLGPCPGSLPDLAAVDTSGLARQLDGVEVTLACDVDNPLTGPHGAAEVYAPQKGAAEREVRVLEARLTRLADVVAAAVGHDYRQRPGSGAAGGVGFAALALLDARLRPGIELVLELVGFRERLSGTDLVVTGEGSLDEQTLRGKAPAGVATVAGEAGVPVVAVCGRNTLDKAALADAGIAEVYALLELEADPRRCMSDAEGLLRTLGGRIAAEWLVPRSGRVRN